VAVNKMFAVPPDAVQLFEAVTTWVPVFTPVTVVPGRNPRPWTIAPTSVESAAASEKVFTPFVIVQESSRLTTGKVTEDAEPEFQMTTDCHAEVPAFQYWLARPPLKMRKKAQPVCPPPAPPEL